MRIRAAAAAATLAWFEFGFANQGSRHGRPHRRTARTSPLCRSTSRASTRRSTATRCSLMTTGMDRGIAYVYDVCSTGYVIYSSITENHQVSIEKLTPDFTASTFENYGFFPDVYVEVRFQLCCGAHWWQGATLFKRNGRYYALYGSCVSCSRVNRSHTCRLLLLSAWQRRGGVQRGKHRWAVGAPGPRHQLPDRDDRRVRQIRRRHFAGQPDHRGARHRHEHHPHRPRARVPVERRALAERPVQQPHLPGRVRAVQRTAAVHQGRRLLILAR